MSRQINSIEKQIKLLQISCSYSFNKYKSKENVSNITSTVDEKNSLVQKLNHLSKFIQLKTMSQLRSNKTSINSQRSDAISFFSNSRDESLTKKSSLSKKKSIDHYEDFLSPMNVPQSTKFEKKQHINFHVKSSENKFSEHKFKFTLPTDMKITKIIVNSKQAFYETDFDKLIQELKDFCSEYQIINSNNPCINFQTFKNLFSSASNKENKPETFEMELKKSLNLKNFEIFSFANLTSKNSIIHQTQKEEHQEDLTESKVIKNINNSTKISKKFSDLSFDNRITKDYFSCNCYYSKYFSQSISRFYFINF
jgi:hypothetical protein